ncbi:Outer membrane efflux protein [Chitinophaga rupis]|uniref:Outer membrane efflux protein n=1 Tax=Chitinophaga rupis TaxID=573321 RepID=A0A1H8KE97_9BACT|nr:TolC family protein [Chitinophaga rupis]SEN91175.1 Outer membrane efflux protein [Chitinophaga rupis]
MYKTLLISTLLFHVAVKYSFAQDLQSVQPAGSYTLYDIVDMAKRTSISALKAATLKENNYWQWRVFKSNYKPQLILTATIPDYSKTNNPVTQPDGTTQYQPVSISNSNATLSLSQSVAPTGGSIFFNSQVWRFDDFNGNYKRYNAYPFIIGFNQPVFAFNQLKWDKKTEPLRYEESLKGYRVDVEQVCVNAAVFFFNLLIAQINLDIARNNVANNDTIYKIAQLRKELGRMSEHDLLQVKLSLLNSQKDIAAAELALQTSTLDLKTFIGQTDSNRVEVRIPFDIPSFEVDENTAIEKALKNRPDPVSFRRQLIEAQRDVVKAIRDNRLNVNIYGTFGLTSRSDDLKRLYTDPRDQQTLKIGLLVPVLDWGRAKARIKTAEANRKLTEYSIEQERVTFRQEIITQIRQFHTIRTQLILTREADSTAQQRYNISKQSYLVGNMPVTDLNIAMQEKDKAKQEYIEAIRNFWVSYYSIRLLTLYDFMTATDLGYHG